VRAPAKNFGPIQFETKKLSCCWRSGFESLQGVVF
jgi:hypothetical protein